MKKVFVISIISLLLVSCSTKNVAIAKLDQKARIYLSNEVTDNFKNDTIEHIPMKQECQEVNESESSIVEDYSLHPDITDDRKSLTDSTKKNIELDQVIAQPFNPHKKQEKVINEQIKASTHPPITTHTPVEATPPPIEEPKELAPDPLCPNAWYDENQPCDWIHPNLKPTDEVGRTVPIFSKSEDAWNWAEKQLFDETSTWYMCGFNIMDGHTNDGTTFFYGYMKACP